MYLGMRFLVAADMLIVCIYWLRLLSRGEGALEEGGKGVALAFLAVLISSNVGGWGGLYITRPYPSFFTDVYNIIWGLYVTLLIILAIANYFIIKPFPVSLGIMALSLPSLVTGINILINYRMVSGEFGWLVYAGIMIVVLSIAGLLSPATVKTGWRGLVYLCMALLVVGAILSVLVGLSLFFNIPLYTPWM